MPKYSWFWDHPEERARLNAVAAEVLPPPPSGERRSVYVCDVLKVWGMGEVPSCEEGIARLREYQARQVAKLRSAP